MAQGSGQGEMAARKSYASRLNLRRGASTTSTSPVLGAGSVSSCAGYSLAGVFPVPGVISAAGRLFLESRRRRLRGRADQGRGGQEPLAPPRLPQGPRANLAQDEVGLGI